MSCKKHAGILIKEGLRLFAGLVYGGGVAHEHEEKFCPVHLSVAQADGCIIEEKHELPMDNCEQAEMNLWQFNPSLRRSPHRKGQAAGRGLYLMR